MKLLVVEDEPYLRSALEEALRSEGYTVDSAADGIEGENLARLHPYDCILLDVMLPRRDGLTVCRNLRSAGNVAPILMLTARDTTADRVQGLDTGADDYLVKPFAREELLARIRSLLRRPRVAPAEILALDGLLLDTRAQTLTVEGKSVTLTAREYGLLEYLLRNRDAVRTREDIAASVWDRFFDSLSNVVDVHIKNLRKKLPRSYAKRLVTIRGKGYRLT